MLPTPSAIAIWPRTILAFILLFGFFARAATFKSPLLDHHAWRQADTASIARNFYRERFNILYPQVDARGANPTGYVETGLELFAFGVAAIAKIVGFHVEIGRILSALLFLCSGALVWTFVKQRDGPQHAIIATFLYAFGFPLALFIERAFMNEALLICLSLACLVGAQRYLMRGELAMLALLIVASALTGAVKLPYLIVWAPVIGLFVEADGVRVWRRRELWLMVVVGLTALAGWYLHAHQLALTTGLSFGLSDKLFDAQLVLSWDFSYTLARRLFKDVLGPVGFVGVVAGTWFAMRSRRWCEVFGVAGFVAYLVIVARGNYIHDYYQLAIIPVAPSIATFGLVRLIELSAPAVPDMKRRRILVWVLGLAAAATFARSVSFHSWYDYLASDIEFCDTVRRLGAADERVVFLGDNDPRLMFCLDRKGWMFPAHEADEAHLRSAWTAGAKLAVVPSAVQDPGARRLLAESATSLFRRDDVEVFRFR